MSDSRRLLLMKLVLGQANIVLEKMHNAMDRQSGFLGSSTPPLQIEGITKEEIEGVKDYVSALSRSDEVLRAASQDEEFEQLVDDLQSVEMNITAEEVNSLDDYEVGILQRFWGLFRGN